MSACSKLERLADAAFTWLPPILWPLTWIPLIGATFVAVVWDETRFWRLFIPRGMRK